MQKFVSIKEKAAKYAHHTFWQRGEAVEMHTLYQKNGLTSMGVSENQGKVPIFLRLRVSELPSGISACLLPAHRAPILADHRSGNQT